MWKGENKLLAGGISKDMAREQVLEELTQELAPYRQDPNGLALALGRLKATKEYGKMLKSKMFRRDLEAKLGT